MNPRFGRARNAWVALSIIMLSACTSTARQQRDQAALERFEKYAGPPIEQFTWLGHYWSWQYLAQYKLVVWTTPNNAYLITVLSPCEDLPWVQHIGLTSTQSMVSSRFDFVLVRHWKCQIKQIQPVDYVRMRQEMRAEHQGEKSGTGNESSPKTDQGDSGAPRGSAIPPGL